MIEVGHLHFLLWVVGLEVLAILSEIAMECDYKHPVIVELFLAEFDGVEGDIDFELKEGVLKHPEVD